MMFQSMAHNEKLDVLVVDDDEAGLGDLTASLRRAGLVCAAASTGWEALEALLKGPVPSVMVIDIRMPELDGLELAQRLGRTDGAKLPEFVFISGSAELRHAVDAIRLRARDLLTKPIDLRRLIQIIRDVQLERQVQSLSKAVPYRHDLPFHAKPAVGPPPTSIDVDAMSTVVLNSLRKIRRVRSENLPSGLAVEASWEILLDLYVSELRSESTSLTALGGSVGMPMTSGLRRVHELESKGMVVRIPDEKDRRRAAVRLTKKGRDTVQSFIRSYVTSWTDANAQRVDE